MSLIGKALASLRVEAILVYQAVVLNFGFMAYLSMKLRRMLRYGGRILVLLLVLSVMDGKLATK